MRNRSVSRVPATARLYEIARELRMLFLLHRLERLPRCGRLKFEIAVARRNFRMHFERSLVESRKREARKCPHARERDIPLAVFKCLREVHMRRVERHPLTLVYRNRPCEPERYLRDFG